MLAEATTTEISKEKNPINLKESKVIAKQGGTIAGNTRRQIEAKTGKKIVSSQNAKQLKGIENKKKLKLNFKNCFYQFSYSIDVSIMSDSIFDS